MSLIIEILFLKKHVSNTTNISFIFLCAWNLAVIVSVMRNKSRANEKISFTICGDSARGRETCREVVTSCCHCHSSSPSPARPGVGVAGWTLQVGNDEKFYNFKITLDEPESSAVIIFVLTCTEGHQTGVCSW